VARDIFKTPPLRGSAAERFIERTKIIEQVKIPPTLNHVKLLTRKEVQRIFNELSPKVKKTFPEMVFKVRGLVTKPIEDFTIFNDFSCCPLGSKKTDLDDFIHDEARRYHEEKAAFTYGLFYDKPGEAEKIPLGFATLQHDTIKIEGEKYPYTDMPAVKIAHFGIRRELHGLGLGSTFLAMICQLMSRQEWRFIILYISSLTMVKFYEKNNFTALGRKPAKLKPTKPLIMYLDLRKNSLWRESTKAWGQRIGQ